MFDWSNKPGQYTGEHPDYDECMKRFLNSWAYDMGWDHSIDNKMDEDHEEKVKNYCRSAYVKLWPEIEEKKADL